MEEKDSEEVEEVDAEEKSSVECAMGKERV